MTNTDLYGILSFTFRGENRTLNEYLTKINWVDVVILILLIRTSYVGLTRGFSSEFLTLLGIFTSIILAIHNYKKISDFLISRVNLPVEFSNFIGFLIIAAGTFLLCRFVKILFFKIVKLELVGGLEKIGGCLLGMVRGCLLVSLILLISLLIPNDYLKVSILDKSFSGIYFLKIAPTCYDYTLDLLPQFKASKKNDILEEILSRKSIKRNVDSDKSDKKENRAPAKNRRQIETYNW